MQNLFPKTFLSFQSSYLMEKEKDFSDIGSFMNAA